MREIYERNTKEAWRSLALYGTMSLNLGVMALGGYFLGDLAERYWHWKYAAIFGVLLGIILGFYEMITIILKTVKKTK